MHGAALWMPFSAIPKIVTNSEAELSEKEKTPQISVHKEKSEWKNNRENEFKSVFYAVIVDIYLLVRCRCFVVIFNCLSNLIKVQPKIVIWWDSVVACMFASWCWSMTLSCIWAISQFSRTTTHFAKKKI